MFVLGGFWKTKSCILCLGFRLGERLGDMLLSSCNGGQYVWWAFVITPNEFECLHELNVKVNQTLCGAEDWKWEKEGCSEYTSSMGVRGPPHSVGRSPDWYRQSSEAEGDGMTLTRQWTLHGGEREKTGKTLNRIAAQIAFPKWLLRRPSGRKAYHSVAYDYTM